MEEPYNNEPQVLINKDVGYTNYSTVVKIFRRGFHSEVKGQYSINMGWNSITIQPHELKKIVEDIYNIDITEMLKEIKDLRASLNTLRYSF